ncbi:MAG: Swarming motility protein SwrC [Parcubacteria group bacterium ADurb.Bin159]|nr:MAG: Swarming motility protein SwrC [Parcubacteria group bacterium ADurb.Bin159]
MKIVNFSVNKPVTILMVNLIIVVLGIMVLPRLGLDMLPDIEYPVVSIITNYSGVAPEDIENILTKPIEEAVAAIKGVKSISSFSREGTSMIMVEFNWGTNIDFATEDIRDKIGQIENYLPSDATKPLVLKINVEAMPILAYGVTNSTLDTLELKKILEDNVKDKLERLDGVASVDLRGGKEREILVKINKPLLESYGLDQTQIVQILKQENINLSGGSIKESIEEFSLRTTGEYKNLEELKNTVITIKNNTPIYLKDIAEVIDTHKEIKTYARTNQKDSILMLINKQSGINTVQAAESVKKELAELKKYLPSDIDFALVLDQSKIITTSTNSVTQSVIVGGFLVISLLFLFLRDWRPTFAIALAIPLSLIATFIPLYLAGYTLNLMTLGGLALGVGMLVDNAVVVIENIYRHLEEGKERREAAKIGASEVGMAIIASSLTTIAVFVPMALGTGIAGQLSRGLSLTIVFALLSSLFVALTLIPVLASKIFKKRTKEEYRKTSGEKSFEKFQNFYEKILTWSLNHRLNIILMTIGFLIIALFCLPFVGSQFLPQTDMGTILLQMKMPPGTSLEETNRVMGQIEEVAMRVKDLEKMTSFIGSSLGIQGGGTNEGMIMISLKDKKEREMTSIEVQEIIRKNIPPIRGLEANFMDMGSSFISGVNAPVEIKIFGPDLDELKKISHNIMLKISNVEGIRDATNSFEETKTEMVININREMASRFGLSIGQIASAVKNSMQGVVATQLRQGGEEVDIRVKYDESYLNDIEDIKNISIVSPLGSRIFLKQIADIRKEKGPVTIEREDQLRVVSVTANTVDRDIGSIINDIKEELKDEVLPTGYFLEYGGSYSQMQETFKTLGMALILGIILVYMIMASQFESLIYPFIIMFELPLAFIGVGLVLFITRQAISLPSIMGMIMLAGIIVNNAIVLVDYVNQLRQKGIKKQKALIQAGRVRLRPILITSLTTILGMFPLALAQAEGSEIMKPMAITMIGGLLTSTFLTLVIIPVIYSLLVKEKKQA